MVTTIGNYVVKKKKKKTKNKRKIQRGGDAEGDLERQINNGYNIINLSIGTSNHFVKVLQNTDGITPTLASADGFLGQGAYGVVKHRTFDECPYAFKIPKFPDCANWATMKGPQRDAIISRIHQLYKDTFQELDICLILQSRSKVERGGTESMMRAGGNHALEEDELKTISPPHPNIAQLKILILQRPTLPVLGLALAMGGALDKQLYEEKWKPEPRHIIQFIKEIGGALDHLHTAYNMNGPVVPILHRDLKSANVLLTAPPESDFSFQLTDFGLARRKGMDPRGTVSMSGCGSGRWMAPEIWLGDIYNEKVDIFSFAMTILEMVSQKLPWDELPREERLTLGFIVANRRFRPDTQLNNPDNTQVDDRVKELIRNCWEPLHSNRPTAAECVAKVKGL